MTMCGRIDPSECDYGKLLKLLEGSLSLEESLELYSHLDLCAACKEMIRFVARENQIVLRAGSLNDPVG